MELRHNYVDTIIERKQTQLKTRINNKSIDVLRAIASMQSRPVPFMTSVDPHEITIIGQIVYQLPRTGDLSTLYDPVLMARSYVSAGADAVALFTDSVIEYDGTLDHMLISDVLRSTNTAVISQDYILHEYHIVEARVSGASVVTLRAGMLPPDKLRLLTSAAHRNRMTAIVEVYTLEQLKAVLPWSPQVIGLSSTDILGQDVDFDFIDHMLRHMPRNQRVMITLPLISIDEVHYALDRHINTLMLHDRLLLGEDIADILKSLHPRT